MKPHFKDHDFERGTLYVGTTTHPWKDWYLYPAMGGEEVGIACVFGFEEHEYATYMTMREAGHGNCTTWTCTGDSEAEFDGQDGRSAYALELIVAKFMLAEGLRKRAEAQILKEMAQ